MVSKISDVAVEIVVGLDGSATLQEAGRTGSLTPYVQVSVPSKTLHAIRAADDVDLDLTSGIDST
jgi:hypothetical protein